MAGTEVLGSVEYGVSVLGRPLVVVLGHDSCGAIAAACAAADGGSTPAGVELLLERSRVLAERVADGRLAVVGLSYRLVDGSARLVAAHGLSGAAVSTHA
ncbi:carbonic anhydrase [Sphaerisporangium sp. B11E5]|uniref:carbonic anhydrase n=1 Tax=Sphaerisporangium sp. B11E5 TaxID=3153563 RepID=UPI00325CAD11